MRRIRFDFGTLTLDAELLDTPTARAVAAALPISSSALTWGEEVYFEIPVKAAAEKDARAGYSRRGRILAGRPRDRARLRPHADQPRRRNAAGEPMQRFRQGHRQREGAGEGEGRRESQRDPDRLAPRKASVTPPTSPAPPRRLRA